MHFAETYVKQRLGIDTRRKRRRGVDHRVDARERLRELAVRDVGHLDDLERGVRAVELLECGDLLAARRRADMVAILQELVDNVRREEA